MGLVIGREGFPRAHEIFEGNTQDRKTLASMLDLLEKRVGLSEGSTVVVDRGMAFAENIAELRRRKLHYVVAAGQKERDRLLAEFETVDGFEEVIRQPSPRNPSQKKSSVRVKAHPLNNETLILCISHERVEKGVFCMAHPAFRGVIPKCMRGGIIPSLEPGFGGWFLTN